MSEDLSALGRVSYLRSTIKNWPLVVPDKLGLVRMCHYRTRTGLDVFCRARSTDINEAVAVLSGLEYPASLVGLRDGDVVFDLGANIGTFVLYVDELNRGIDFRGFAFEPFQENFALLERNVRANHISTFRTVQAAVTDVDGEVSLWTDCEPDRVRVSGPATGDDPAPARSYRLSTYSAANGIESIELLKADVEGAEYDILGNDLPFIRASVRNLLIEYHDLGGDRNFGGLSDLLRDDFELKLVHERSVSGVFHARNKSLAR